MWGHKGENNPKGADGGLCHENRSFVYASIRRRRRQKKPF
jgi:hypothetical protein